MLVADLKAPGQLRWRSRCVIAWAPRSSSPKQESSTYGVFEGVPARARPIRKATCVSSPAEKPQSRSKPPSPNKPHQPYETLYC